MPEQVYRELMEVMKKRGGPYTGRDIPEFYALVEELFTPEEAAVNNAMPRGPFRAQALAELMGKDRAEAEKILETMADKGLCRTFTRQGTRYYTSERFVPGIFEFQFMPGKTSDRDKKIAHLIHAYETAFNAAVGPVKVTYPTTRVITVDSAVEPADTVHTYDQVSTYIDKYDPICVTACYCRHAAKLRDEDLHGMPIDVCMQFGESAQYAIERLGGRELTKREARQVLDLSEEAGLVHMAMNTSEDIGFICNCDRWHCGAVKGVLQQDKPGRFFNSGFRPRFDGDLCTACGTCIDRCPASALTLEGGGPPEVDLDRCFGCAVCATGCPTEAVRMERKPDFPAPPRDPKELGAAVRASRM